MSQPSKQLDVVIGVNGIGMGHSIRQSVIAEYLRDRGHRVRIVTNGADRVAYFRRLGFTAWDSWMPKLVARGDRIRAADAIRANTRTAAGGLARHIQLRRTIHMSTIPDVFITDYEPNTSRLAYHFNRPLVSIDQQSKYRYLELPRIGDFANTSDEQRLRYFTPRADRFFVASFVPLRSDNPAVEYLGPIVPSSVRTLTPTTQPLLVAYFSRYFNHGPDRSVKELADVCRRFLPGRTLRVYATRAEFDTLRVFAGGNVEVLPFERDEFIGDLSRCEAVFSNAGFNLIGEAFTLGKPIHIVPLPTYDQHWCAKTIDEQGLGTSATQIRADDVISFLDVCPSARANVMRLRAIHLAADPRQRITDYVEAITSDTAARPRLSRAT